MPGYIVLIYMDFIEKEDNEIGHNSL